MDKGINRIMLDSRPLFSVPATTAAMIDAQGRSRGCRCTCWPPPMLPWCGSSACRIRPPTTPSCQAGCPTGASGWQRAKISTSLYIRPTTPSPRAGPSGCPPAGEEMAPGRGENDRAQQGVLPFSQPPHPVFPPRKKPYFCGWTGLGVKTNADLSSTLAPQVRTRTASPAQSDAGRYPAP